MAFDPVSAVLDIGGTLIKHFFPDPKDQDAAKLKLLELQQSGALAELTANTDLAKAQAAINQQEAASNNLFVAGWRPAVGWVCALALAYSFFIQPFIQFLATLFHLNFDPKTLPVLDWGMLGQLLFGMLGLAGMRSYEKVKGASTGQ